MRDDFALCSIWMSSVLPCILTQGATQDAFCGQYVKNKYVVVEYGVSAILIFLDKFCCIFFIKKLEVILFIRSDVYVT